MSSPAWLDRRGGECLLRLHIQPRASRTGIAGIHGDRLKIRIHAPPQDGAANDELTRFLADAFGVPRSRVVVVSGHSHRDKTVSVREPVRYPDWLMPADG